MLKKKKIIRERKITLHKALEIKLKKRNMLKKVESFAILFFLRIISILILQLPNWKNLV